MSAETPTSGWFEGRIHRLPVRIYYEDTDFTGLVYHANYLRYFERGRSDFLRLAGVDHTALLNGESPTAFTIIRITIDFLKPARVDDALEARTTYDRVSGARLFITQSLLRGEVELARAAVEACCITPDARPKRPPPLLMERISPFLEA